MKPSQSKAIIEDVKKRGYILVNDTFYPPNSVQALQSLAERPHTTSKKNNRSTGLKTGFIDDHRNIKNKDISCDMFDMLVKKVLGIEVWPEFYFSVDRAYRIDKALPVDAAGRPIKIGIEIQGGIWLRGASGHSSGTGIKRDMEKNNLAASLGWNIIKIEPYQIAEKHWGQTIELIRKAIELKNL